MTTWMSRRWAKSVGVLASALALSLGASLAPVAPAYAADPPVTADKQNYYKYYNLKSIHDQGITGKGVTIAVLDGAVNTNIPELKGANIQDRMPCIKDSAPENMAHGTTVAQILVSPEFGVAPDATLYTYTLPLHGDASNCTLSGWTGEAVNDTPLLIEQAINDGADIITISSNFDDDSIDLRWAMARALAEGVIVVAAMGNETTENPDDALARWRGICGIGATMPNGTLTEYTNWGNGLLTTALGTVLTRDVSTGRVEEADGTSFATPIIAGFLALGRQHFDEDVSPEQMLQALAATGKSGRGWNKYTGYGPVDPIAFLRSDPSQYANENPCVPQVYSSLPSWDDVAAYMDGVVNPILIRNDDVYVYRGVNEEAALSREHGYPTHIGTSPRYHSQ
ncbi:MAG: S8 family serine peptidase [Actinomyces sp.]|nr:S8 family serine peptidase [Actinomyces sp.]